MRRVDAEHGAGWKLRRLRGKRAAANATAEIRAPNILTGHLKGSG
jgi:hypothetical protein